MQIAHNLIARPSVCLSSVVCTSLSATLVHTTQAAVIFDNISTALGTEFDMWGRLAETGNGHKSQLVAIESARLEQRPGMLTFDEVMKFVAYYTANFPH